MLSIIINNPLNNKNNNNGDHHHHHRRRRTTTVNKLLFRLVVVVVVVLVGQQLLVTTTTTTTGRSCCDAFVLLITQQQQQQKSIHHLLLKKYNNRMTCDSVKQHNNNNNNSNILQRRNNSLQKEQQDRSRTRQFLLYNSKDSNHHTSPEEEEDILTRSKSSSNVITTILDSYWGPRIVLSLCAAIYGTNFALGSLMNESLPASAVTASRMTFAGITLFPFVLQIKSSLLPRTILTGCCAAMGYVTQSMALTDTDPARVSFLGAATVLWLPILEATIDQVPMSLTDAPQTWMAAILCLLGVGILELYDPSNAGVTTTAAAAAAAVMTSGIHYGDLLALLQAIGFGTGAFLSSKLVREEPDQVLSITSVLIVTTAVLSWIWCFVEGSTVPLVQLIQSDPVHNNIPLVLAVLWTGIVSTSMNYVVEIAALGRVPPAEASVLLASEPIWAALFAAFLLHETLGINDYIGGTFIVAACLVNAVLKPNDILKFFNQPTDDAE